MKLYIYIKMQSVPTRINIIDENNNIIKKIPIIRKIEDYDKKYKNGKIYKLYNDTHTYIGSTIKSLNWRLTQHKHKMNTNAKIILENPPYTIELIENYPCRNKKELEQREGFFIRNTKCVNIIINGRTKAEWGKDNKDRLKEYHRDWWQNNKEECREKHKLADKKYYEKNKNKKNEYNRKFRANNNEYREKLNEYKRQKVKCDICSISVSRNSLKRHKDLHLTKNN